jgi:hypothetical protein
MVSRAAAGLLFISLLTACGGGDGPLPPDDPNAVTLVFRMKDRGADQEFRHRTASPALIAKARAQMALPVADRKLFPAGAIAAGAAGVNLNWGWHFKNVDLVEATIELCDGNPTLVQADLNYWLNTVKAFCPWGGYVHAVTN